MGIGLILMGILTFVLPHFGYQYNFMELFGKGNEPIVGTVLIVVGILATIGGAALDRRNQNINHYY